MPLVYFAHPMTPVEPPWITALSGELGRSNVQVYRPAVPLIEQLQNKALTEALERPPAPKFRALAEALQIDSDLFEPLQRALPSLAEADVSEPLVRSVRKDLFCLMRSDLVVCDLTSMSMGDQGHDILFARAGGLVVVGVTDRFQQPPALLRLLTALVAPTSQAQLVNVILTMLPIQHETVQYETPRATMRQDQQTSGPIDVNFASQVLAEAGRSHGKDAKS